MSLDVYLVVGDKPTKKKGSGVFVRKNGKTYELTLDEAKKLYPNREFVETEREEKHVYHDNITHNLGVMAVHVPTGTNHSLYHHLWRADEIGVQTANQLTTPLENALLYLLRESEKLKVHNPSNGWGDYDGLLDFVFNYLKACHKYPSASVIIFR